MAHKPSLSRTRKQIRQIIAAVAQSHGYTEADLLVRDRHRPVVKARHAAFRACCDAGFTYAAVAAVGGWHGSAISYGAGRDWSDK